MTDQVVGQYGRRLGGNRLKVVRLASYRSAADADSGSRSDAPSWDRAVADYLRECRRANLSPATLHGYRTFLLGGRMADYLARHPVESVADLDREFMRGMQVEFHDAGLSASTVMDYHRVVHTFAKFCREEGWLINPGVFSLKAPRVPQEVINVISAEDERLLLEACRSERDRFLVRFMIRTGLRLREVCGLTVDDVVEAPTGWLVRVRSGKGRKPRAIPLDTGARNFSAEVADYIHRVRPDGSSDALFLTSRRFNRTGRAAYAPLAPAGLYRIFNRLAEATGLRVSPHTCRHTMATRALAAGVNIGVLQRVLGHTTPTMTLRYVHASTTDVLAAWAERKD